MVNVLVIDDEKLIRDNVCGLLAMEEELELDLVAASSGVEAQKILEKRNIDIVITDIEMPNMTGLELFDIIKEKWPRCKVIFLTGYSEFEYVYKVHQHARYILKAEEDERIIEAVKECITEMEEELLMENMTALEQEHISKTMMYARNNFLLDLLAGYVNFDILSQELADDMQMNLDIKEEVYYVILRHNSVHPDGYLEGRRVQADALKLIEKFFYESMNGVYFPCSRNFYMLLMQPKKKLRNEHAIAMLKSNCELFQKALYMNTKWKTAVLMGGRTVPMWKIMRDFQSVADEMIWLDEDGLMIKQCEEREAAEAVEGNYAAEPGNGVGEEDGKSVDGKNSEYGSGTAGRNADSGILEAEKEIGGKKKAALGVSMLTEEAYQRILTRVRQAEYYTGSLDEENAMQLLKELQEDFKPVRSMNELFALESYCSISATLLGCIARLGLNEEIAFRIGIRNLYNVSMHSSWFEAFGYLCKVAENIFILKSQNMEKGTEDVVNVVKQYIWDHLSGDTSLYTLAEQVHFSQEYLLRTFKKKEGITILQYINDLKLNRARQLLSETDMPVKVIAEELGFTSVGYFGRFFRGKTGLSPNAYREKFK